MAPPASDYVKLAVGRDYTDVSPVNGSFLSRGGTVERAQTVSRVLQWASGQDVSSSDGIDAGLDQVARMAASVRGVSVSPDESALDALLTGDSGTSLRGCLAAALYNATQVAPVEIIQIIGAAIQTVDEVEDSPSTTEDVATLMQDILALLHELHQSIAAAWFHTEALSEEEVYRRFVQQ